jgi:hypothetical protein
MHSLTETRPQCSGAGHSPSIAQLGIAGQLTGRPLHIHLVGPQPTGPGLHAWGKISDVAMFCE